MSSKQAILAQLQRVRVPDEALPDVTGAWLTFPRPRERFAEVLEAVGGRALRAAAAGELPQVLAGLPAFQAAQQVWSLVPAVPSRGEDWSRVTDPHALEVLDVCVAPGTFAVAENAAVWITPDRVPHRAALFISQHLVLGMPADQIVHNMHEAYQRIDPAQVRFGVFISGPSKTADIEQSLVIGAHGPRSLTVVWVGAD